MGKNLSMESDAVKVRLPGEKVRKRPRGKRTYTVRYVMNNFFTYKK